MTRHPGHTAPEGSRDALKAKSGKALDIHGAMAHSPAVLETIDIRRGRVDDPERSIVVALDLSPTASTTWSAPSSTCRQRRRSDRTHHRLMEERS